MKPEEVEEAVGQSEHQLSDGQGPAQSFLLELLENSTVPLEQKLRACEILVRASGIGLQADVAQLDALNRRRELELAARILDVKASQFIAVADRVVEQVQIEHAKKRGRPRVRSVA